MRKDGCITDEELSAWATGAVSADQQSAMAAHVAACDTCRVVLAEVARTTGERPTPRTMGRYQLEEQVGAGGMGTVWSAWDPTVGRRVAVKVLHETRGDATQRARRFLQERQVLAGLQHPNIARLLDAGETTEGHLWFAMDFVDGLPLDAYCDQHRLSTRQRLELLLPVFDAVAFAHRHLVVHRDLKPSNILVGNDGAPRLVDFGIARLLEGDDGLTQTGWAPMTPAYASPEQVRREPIATNTDVYSLGVVLYEVLSGVSPYAVENGQLDALLAAIRDAEPPPASRAVERAAADAVATRAPSRERLRRELGGDLDAVLAMALRKDPRDRYTSVEALADDVRATLDGRPTAARRGSATYRAVRFLRRHKAAVSALTATFLALAAGVVSTAWQAQRAERERDLARRRFDEVRALARAVLFDYHDGIANLPGSTPLRERLVKDAQAYLDGLATEAEDDVALRRELAQSYLKLGDVQGDPFSASLGDLDAARASYLRARTLAESVLAAAPQEWDARRVVASSHEKLGALAEVNGQLDVALAEYDVAHGLDAALAAERPGDLEVRLAASRDDLAAGQVLIALARLEEASQRLERALAERKAVLAQRDDSVTRRGVGTVLLSLAEVREETGRLPEAIAYAEEAERLFEEMVKQNPDAVEQQRGLSGAWGKLTGLYRLAGDLPRAEAVARKSVHQARAAAAGDPQNVVAARDLVVTLGNLGITLRAEEKWDDYERVENEALELQRALRAKSPENARLREDLVVLLTTAAAAAVQRGQPAKAEGHLRDLLDVAKSFTADGGVDSVVAEEAAMAHTTLAAVRADQGRPEDAIAELRLAQAGLQALLDASPGLDRVRTRLLIAVASEGEVQVQLAEHAPKVRSRAAWEAARDTLKRALADIALVEGQGKGNTPLAEVRDEVKVLLTKCEQALGAK